MPPPTAISSPLSMPCSITRSMARTRAAVMEELRRLLPGAEDERAALPFGLAALDSHLPEGGLACGALHEVVPETQSAFAAAFGFIVAFLARLSRAHPLIFVMPAYGRRRLWPSAWSWPQLPRSRSGPADPGRDGAPQRHAVGHGGGVALGRAGRRRRDDRPSSISRPAKGCISPPAMRACRSSSASGAHAGSERGGNALAHRHGGGRARPLRPFARPRWHLQLERCRNGRPGEWVVEYDHVAHRFSLAAALADPALSRGAGELESCQASRLILTGRSSLPLPSSGGPRIAALNEAAEAAGLAPGEPLADARAKAGFLQVRAVDAAADDAALRRLALWATRYTPTASPWNEENGADGFFLDIEGAAHLFGGEAKLIADLAARLGRFGLPARLAVADTPGAAWALSRFHAAARCVLPSGRGSRSAGAVADRSVAAVGGNPHCAAPARFQIGRRADRQAARALCRAFCRRAAAPSRPGARPRRRAAGPDRRAAGLSQPALSARADHHPGSGRRPRQPPDAEPRPCARCATMSARARCGFASIASTARSRPSISVSPRRRAASPMWRGSSRSSSKRSRRWKMPASASRRSALPSPAPSRCRRGRPNSPPSHPSPQAGRVGWGHGDRAERCAALIDALRQRLGPPRVRRFEPVASHLPERAEVLPPIDGETSPWPEPEQPRPLLLLPHAEPTEVTALVPDGPPRRFCWRGVTYDVAAAQGPERIGTEWWRAPPPYPSPLAGEGKGRRADARLLPRRGRRRPPLLALSRRTLRARDGGGALVRARAVCVRKVR